jgi:cytochrome o ubiquinol oxidase subunit 1
MNCIGNFFSGKLTLEALPHQWYTISATVFFAITALIIALILTKKKRWGWLWHEWLTSTDPKKIGTMYVIFATFMFFRGMVDAAMIWLQQAIAADSNGYLTAGHFQEIFTSHGDIMVFFVTMGFFFGFMNWIVPLQIGARDLAFPFLNSLGFWLTVAGGLLINLFFIIGGHFANTGWLAITPLSELEFNPGEGVDYLIWSLQLSGLGSLLAAINFIATIIKERAPGMTLMRMPLFVWTSLCGMVLIISAFPVLTAVTFMLWLDRFFDMHFFTTSFGGNQMMYFNLIWMWGHPEVYILVLPAFGMYSEIISTFSQKRISGYASMVVAAIIITLLSYLVWLHHFFTMGAGPDVNFFFGIVTMLIAIPSGVQVFNWILTMFRGKIIFSSAMCWSIGFVITFLLGGMTGVFMASPPADFQVHNSLFLVAHFHTQIIGIALFGVFAGLTYWFPKIMGFKLNERLGKYAFWLWFIGFYVSFTPLFLLGFMGAGRRLDHYPSDTGWQPLFIAALIGFGIISAGILIQVIQYIISIRDRKHNLDTTGDPWNGRTLEWAIPSPPPFYSFAIIPTVSSNEPFWDMKQKKEPEQRPYEEIEIPKNTGVGIYIAAFSFLAGFGIVWHLIWLIILGIAGAVACVILYSFHEDTKYHLPAAKVAEIEKSRREGGAWL